MQCLLCTLSGNHHAAGKYDDEEKPGGGTI